MVSKKANNELIQVQELLNKKLLPMLLNVSKERGERFHLIKYYNLFLTNIDKHKDLVYYIKHEKLSSIAYEPDEYGYTNGKLIFNLKEVPISYEMELLYDNETIKNYLYEDEEIQLNYSITQIKKLNIIKERNTNKELLHKIETCTNEKLKNFKNQQKKTKMKQLLKKRMELNSKIISLQNSIYCI